MRVNFVYGEDTDEVSVARLTKLSDAINSSEEDVWTTVSDEVDEESDMNIIYEASAVPTDSTTEIVYVAKEKSVSSEQLNSYVEMYDYVDGVVALNEGAQELVYDITGMLAPIVGLSDSKTWTHMILGDV